MRRTFTWAGALLLTMGIVSAAPAQTADVQRVHLEVFRVPTDQMEAFEEVAATIVEAAEQAELSPDFGWWFYQDGPRYTVVSPVKSMGQFDDPEYWIRAFEGTPGEATLAAAMEEYGKLTARVQTSVIQGSGDWSYRPASPRESKFARVMLARVKPSMQTAFDRNVRAWMKALREVGYPYRIDVHRTLIVEAGLSHIVIHHDDMAAIHGEGAVPAVFEKAGRSSDYERLIGELMECLEDYRWEDHTFRPDISYMPEAS